MKKSKSSRRWLDEHFNDHYVKEAQHKGYRSRACFKLLEIQAKDKIIKPGMAIVDLGAAPGGWSQVCGEILQGNGKVFALDLLLMDKLPDVTFIQGDFTDEAILNDLISAIDDKRVDCVLSDMAPNMSGHKAIDEPKSMYLVELALEFCRTHLKKNGVFLVKCFQGQGFDAFLKEMRAAFKVVSVRKPKASRDRSKEVYLLGKSFLGN